MNYYVWGIEYKPHTKCLWIFRLPKLWAENTFSCVVSTLSFFITGISGFFKNSEDITPVLLYWGAAEFLFCSETVQIDFLGTLFLVTLLLPLIGKTSVSTLTFFPESGGSASTGLLTSLSVFWLLLTAACEVKDLTSMSFFFDWFAAFFLTTINAGRFMPPSVADLFVNRGLEAKLTKGVLSDTNSSFLLDSICEKEHFRMLSIVLMWLKGTHVSYVPCDWIKIENYLCQMKH